MTIFYYHYQKCGIVLVLNESVRTGYCRGCREQEFTQLTVEDWLGLKNENM